MYSDDDDFFADLDPVDETSAQRVRYERDLTPPPDILIEKLLGEEEEARDELYKNRSSRKTDSQRLFSREYDFPKTFSLTENQFSRKT